jgi:putative ABC transport system permease protein
MRFPDLALAVRNLQRRPTFAVTAIVLLALGAGVNAAVFSVVRGVLLKPLPYQRPESLVAIWPEKFANNEEIAYWRERARSFDAIAAVSPGWLMAFVTDGVEPVKVTGARTSDNFFTTLGVGAALGRTILPGDASPGRARVVVISAEVYAQQFSSDPRTIGRTVRLDNVSHEIVGVMPRGFEFSSPGTAIWAPLPFDPSSPQHRAQFSQVFGRLAAGATATSASRELTDLVPAMRHDLKREAEWGTDLRVASLQEIVTGDVRPTLLILLVAVGLILLLAAVNVGTLVLGRSLERAREMALRTALGASRARLVRQLVTEQTVLATAGALTGLLLAWMTLPALVRRIPPEIPRQHEIVLDATVFFAVCAASILTAVLLALVPVLLAARPELQPLLRPNQSTETPVRRRALGALVSAQIALAVVLGIAAGLMLRSLWNLQQVDPGFEPSGVLTFRLQSTSKHTQLTTGLPYLQQIVDRVRGLPGVTSVGAIQHLPMTGYNWTAQVWSAETPPAPGATAPSAIWLFVGWDYFQAMGISLRAGRLFGPQDHGEAPAVAIVNEAFARAHYGSAQAAVGRRVATASGAGTNITEIVGVIDDVRFLSLDRAASAEIYRPFTQTFMFPMAFAVRTTGDAAQLAAAIRQIAFAVDSTVPVAELQPLSSLLASSLGRPRLLALLLSIFAAVGLGLGVVGVYGVVAYRVRQREREFGIRLALGAAPERIWKSVLHQGAGHAAVGLLLGLPASMILAQLMQSVVFGITTRDPLTFFALPVGIVFAVLAGCVLPARRAARIDPVTAMRGE